MRENSRARGWGRLTELKLGDRAVEQRPHLGEVETHGAPRSVLLMLLQQRRRTLDDHLTRGTSTEAGSHYINSKIVIIMS